MTQRAAVQLADEHGAVLHRLVAVLNSDEAAADAGVRVLRGHDGILVAALAEERAT